MGEDESEIERRSTISVWVRIADANTAGKIKTIVLAARGPQVGGKAQEVADGVDAVLKEVDSHTRPARPPRPPRVPFLTPPSSSSSSS